MANESHTVTLCKIDTNGGLSDCNPTASGTDFDSPEGITLNAAGNFTYIVGDTIIYRCAVDKSSGVLSDCKSALDNFNYYYGNLAFNDKGNLAYVGTDFNVVSVCDVNIDDGTLSNCKATGTGFNYPSGIALK